MTDDARPDDTSPDDPRGAPNLGKAPGSGNTPGAESTHGAPAPDPFVDPHARKIPSRAGNWALGMGLLAVLLSLFGGGVLGIPAIVLGFVSLHTPERFRGPALAGIALGGFAIVATLVLLLNPLYRGGFVIEFHPPWEQAATPTLTPTPTPTPTPAAP